MQDQFFTIAVVVTACVSLVHAILWFLFLLSNIKALKFLSKLSQNAQWLHLIAHATIMGPILFNMHTRLYMIPVVFVALGIFLYAKPKFKAEYERAMMKASKSGHIH